jgi:hypothetical protein
MVLQTDHGRTHAVRDNKLPLDSLRSLTESEAGRLTACN